MKALDLFLIFLASFRTASYVSGDKVSTPIDDPKPARTDLLNDCSLGDQDLKLVKIDSDPNESFLGLPIDGTGRIFVGGREGLFVYEPGPHGLYQRRRELYRFPANSWIYNITVRGRDLYILTVSALYVLAEGVVKREDLHPQRLIWGCPVAHVHQRLHGMTLGPDGDLYITR